MVIGSLLGVCILQFVNDMILCSLALSFAVASVILMTFHVSFILQVLPFYLSTNEICLLRLHTSLL